MPLRPLGVGEILDGAISTMRSHPRILLGLSAVVAALTQLLLLPLTAVALRTPDRVTDASPTTVSIFGTGGSLLATLVSYLVSALATLVLSGVLTVVVGRAVLGQGIGLGEAWRLTRPRLLALLGASVLAFLAVVAILGLALAPGIVSAAAAGSPALTAVLLVGGVLLGVPAAIYAYTSLALGPAAAVLERVPALRALRRSRRLVRGSWWRVFGILLLVNVIAGVLSGILSIPFSIGTVLSVLGGDGDVSIVALLLNALGSTIAATITWPFTAAATTLLYIDLRMRREGLDITLARAAGVDAAGSP